MDQPAGVIRIGKERLAAGLFWQSAATAVTAVREARIVAAKAELAADLFCVRRHGTPQFGLGQRKAGHRPGMRAAAAVLANSIDASSWLGAFRVDNGWLVVMVRKGAVMPDGDLLLSSEGEARQRIEAELPSGWAMILAPVEWGIAGARPGEIAALLHRRADARLRPVVPNPLAAVLWLGGALAAAAVLWSMLSPPVPTAPSVANVPPPPPPAPPWEGQPAAKGLILACQAAIESARTLAGYELESVSCGAGGATVRYRRLWGTLTWLPKDSAIPSPDRAIVRVPLPGAVARRGGKERPWPGDRLRRTVWGTAQAYLLDSEVTEPPASALPGRPPGATSGFKAVSVSLGGRLPPAATAAVLGGIPTFVVDEVSWQSMTWRVKGKAYVR